MDPHTRKLFALARFSSGRRLSLYNQLLPVARQRQMTQLVALIETAHLHDLYTRTLDDRWVQGNQRNRYAPEVKIIDSQVDALLGRIRDLLVSHIEDLDDKDPLAARITALLGELFPKGLFAITHLPFIDQVAAVENALARLQGQRADVVAELALTHKVAKLAELTREYRQAVDVDTRLDFAEVRQARDRGHEYLVQIVCTIMVAYPDLDDPEKRAERDELLAPIIAHDQAARAQRRARRGRTDDGDGPNDDGDDDGDGDDMDVSDDLDDTAGEPGSALDDQMTSAPDSDSAEAATGSDSAGPGDDAPGADDGASSDAAAM
ncbi:MAG: hypothetical protein AAGC55_25930 [Myxococcota bacterium]